MSSKATEHVSINIQDINKADVLRVLFNEATPRSANYNKRFDHAAYDAPLGMKEAQRLVKQEQEINNSTLMFNYIYSRAIYADISGNRVDLSEYAYQNPGALEKVQQQLSALRAEVVNGIGVTFASTKRTEESPTQDFSQTDISNIEKALLLRQLFNHAKPPTPQEQLEQQLPPRTVEGKELGVNKGYETKTIAFDAPLERKEANNLIRHSDGHSFGTVHGRKLDIGISLDTADFTAYIANNGQDAVENALSAARTQQKFLNAADTLQRSVGAKTSEYYRSR